MKKRSWKLYRSPNPNPQGGTKVDKDFSKFYSKSFKLKHKLSCLYRKFCKKGSEFCLLWVKISHVNTKLKGLWWWWLLSHTTLLTMAKQELINWSKLMSLYMSLSDSIYYFLEKSQKKKNAHIKIDQPCLSLHFEPESLITSSSSISFNNPFCCSSLAVVNWIWSAFILSWSDLLSGKAVAIFYPFCFHSGSLIPW